MKWLKLQNHGELWSSLYFVMNDVLGDLERQSEWKSHMSLMGGNQTVRIGRGDHDNVGNLGGSRFSQPRQKKGGWRNTFGALEATTSCTCKKAEQKGRSPQKLSVSFHRVTIGWNRGMAISNSGARIGGGSWVQFLLCNLLCLIGLAFLTGGDSYGLTASQAESQWQAAQRAYQTNQFDLGIGIQFAQACFDRAEFAANSSERSNLAERGIEAAKEVIRRNSNSAPGHFYLALNLGQLARTRTFSALGLVSDMERHFLTAISIDPRFQHAAPERSLGMLYAEAPGWPTSIGSRSKARTHLQRAVELDPEYPENLLTWLETELKWGDRKKVQSRLPELDRLLTQAEGAGGSASIDPSDLKDWIDRLKKLRQQASAAPTPPISGARRPTLP